MAKPKRIKDTTVTQGKRINSKEPVNYDKKPPIFSLEKLQKGKYCLSSLNQKNKACFADAIFIRKSMTWSEIKQRGRHQLGTEKIPKNQIKAPLPKFIADDFEDFIVFRYNCLKPMVGYRQRDIFFVIWFDHDHTLYNH